MASETLEELLAPVDTAISGSEESLLVATDMVTVSVTELPTQIDEGGPSTAYILATNMPLPQADEAGPSRAEILVTNVPLPQANEVGPSGIVASRVSKTILESQRIPQVNSKTWDILQVQL